MFASLCSLGYTRKDLDAVSAGRVRRVLRCHCRQHRSCTCAVLLVNLPSDSAQQLLYKDALPVPRNCTTLLLRPLSFYTQGAMQCSFSIPMYVIRRIRGPQTMSGACEKEHTEACIVIESGEVETPCLQLNYEGTSRTAPRSGSSRAFFRRSWSKSRGSCVGPAEKTPPSRCRRWHTYPTSTP